MIPGCCLAKYQVISRPSGAFHVTGQAQDNGGICRQFECSFGFAVDCDPGVSRKGYCPVKWRVNDELLFLVFLVLALTGLGELRLAEGLWQ